MSWAQELSRSELQRCIRNVVERSADFIGIATVEGRLLYVNEGGRRVVGLESMAKACRCHLFDYLISDDRAQVRDKLWRYILDNGRWRGELRFRHFQTGREIPIFADWFRIDDRGHRKAPQIATIARDLTEQVALELSVAARTAELQEANKTLLRDIEASTAADRRLRILGDDLLQAARLSVAGQMTTTLAHELTQPFGAAQNAVQAARLIATKGNPHAAAKLRAVLDDAIRHILRASETIRRWRDFIKRGEIERRRESVQPMIEEAAALALSASNAAGVQVTLRLDPSATHVLADRIQIQQVLTNLLRNALEAMELMDQRELALSTRLTSPQSIEIAVSDSGPGIPVEMAGRLFEPFLSAKRIGMGLGLSISRTIVEAHGGKLEMSANEKGGTTFSFSLAAAVPQTQYVQ
jgi:PAS domain S-box-containing protein